MSSSAHVAIPPEGPGPHQPPVVQAPGQVPGSPEPLLPPTHRPGKSWVCVVSGRAGTCHSLATVTATPPSSSERVHPYTPGR